MKKLRTATLVGYHGRRNLGDDIFLRIASKWLVEGCGVARIFVAGKKSGVPSTLHGAQIVPFEKDHQWVARLVWLQIGRYALKSDILLFSAGSIFTIQPFFLAWVVLRCLKLARGSRLRIVALGISVGPLHDAISRRWCPRLFDLMDCVVLRDEESAQILRGLGSAVPVDVSYDLALAWSPAWEAKPPETRMEVRVGLSLHSAAWSKLTGDEASEVVDSIVGGLEVVAPAFSRLEIAVFAVCADTQDGDIAISKGLVDRLAVLGLPVRFRVYDGADLEGFVAEIASCRALVTSRMHAGIVAMMGAVPTLQVAYARKVGDFFAHCGLSNEFLVPPGEVSVKRVEHFLRCALAGSADATAAQIRIELEKKRHAVVAAMNRLGASVCANVR